MGEASRRKRQLKAIELSPHLNRQLAFLQRSVESYDKAFEDEAIRMATVIRVLLHVTKSSKALLNQLGPLPDFWDGAVEFDPENSVSHSGLVALAQGTGGVGYIAPLDDVPSHRRTNFDQWWNAKVFVVQQDRVLSRRDLVLIAADQDGGAHVDPSLDEFYYDLSKNNALGWVAETNSGATVPLGSPIFPAIRQIAHEILKSLIWGYTCERRNAKDSVLMMGLSIKANS